MKFINDNLKSIISFILIQGLFLIFLDPISTLLVTLGENIDFSSKAFKTGYILIAVLLFCSYLFFISKRFIHNKRINFFVLFIFTSYVIYRFIFIEYITFTTLKGDFKFADLIILILFLHLVNFAVVELKKNKIKRREKSDSESFFIEDKIYKDGEIDNEAILNKLMEVVKDFKPDEAFSIGLNAVWGYGKSSFLHRFYNLFKRDNPNQLIFWYRIWKNKGSNAIIENFFQELKTQLKPYSSDISEDISKYVDSILSLSNSDLHNIITKGKDFISENETLENYYTSINNNIEKIDRQIVVLLDDLDRLENIEIINSLKLMRTLSDFNNIIFIAGYDRSYITRTIDSSKDNYLDKIFNVEINLLPFDSDLIIDELFKQVELLFPVELSKKDSGSFNEAFKNLFKDLELSPEEINEAFLGENKAQTCSANYSLSYKDFLPTYRDVKRFLNEFKFNFSFLSNEADVIAQEYILLKLLTYKYRELSILVFSNLEDFLTRTRLDNVNRDNVVIFGDNYMNNIYEYTESNQKSLKNKLDDYSQKDFDIINAVLCRLFGKKPVEYYQKYQNTVAKIFYVDIYLRNNILTGKVSVSDLINAFENSNIFGFVKSVSKNLNKIDIHLTNEIKQFIYNNEPKSQSQYLDQLRTVHYLLPNHNTYDEQKIIDLVRIAFHKFYFKDKEPFLRDIQRIINVGSFGFLDFMLQDINFDYKRRKSGLNYEPGMLKRFNNNEFLEEDIQELFTNKLKFLLENETEPNVLYTLYNQNVDAIVGDKQVLKSFEVSQQILGDVQKRFSEYFNSQWFVSIRNEISELEGESIGYAPNFNLAQLCMNEKDKKALIEDPFNVELYNQFYKNGWENFYYLINEMESFLKKSITEEEVKVIERAKKFVKAFIEKDCKPLNKQEYNAVWHDFPF